MGEAIQAYHSITATEEFRNLEWLRTKTRNDEAQAMNNATRKGAEAERKKWQKKWQGVATENEQLKSVVADKDTALAEQAELIAKLKAQLNKK